jgi:hypothetical protein
MAVERYRLARGHWPESLSELVPEHLKSIPRDPFDGAELRYLDFAEGVIIYSVGPDGVDNGGNITQNPSTPGSDLGFRLWDVEHRRQAPRPFQMPDRTPKPDQ